MVQEILTYIIIAVAVAIAVWRIYKKLSRSKKKIKPDKNLKYAPQHNCSDCIASCSIRDAVPEIRSKNEELCDTTVKPAKDH